MKNILLFLLGLGVLFVLTIPEIPAPEPDPPDNRPNFRLIVASWYGPGFHGRKTANGETYNMYRLTAAHVRLPFNTLVKLINPENNRSIIVRINDRGPYDPGQLRNKLRLIPHPDRDIDLSYQAAKTLGMVRKGIANLYAAVLKRPLN